MKGRGENGENRMEKRMEDIEGKMDETGWKKG
jgi:hypothetical protein